MASYNQKQNSLIQQLKTIVGEKYLLTDPNRTLPYRQGFRFGKGKALAVVIPLMPVMTILHSRWQLKHCSIYRRNGNMRILLPQQ